MTTPKKPFYGYDGDPTDDLANRQKLFLDFYHVPTGRNVEFKAFLTSYSEAFTSTWNEEDVYGRMDDPATFQKTVRVISLGWAVIAASDEESQTNLQRCADLASILYPVYDGHGASSLAAPPLIKLRFANLIFDVGSGKKNLMAPASESGLLGKMDGFTYTPDLDAGMFQLGPGLIYPKVIEVSCSFTVKHSHPLGFDSAGNKRTAGFPYGEDDISSPVNVVPTPAENTDEQTEAAEDDVLFASPTGGYTKLGG
jgi:hypothetical protein